jgi:hypothetical protein
MSDWQQEGGEEGVQQESTPETPQEGGQQEGGQPGQEGGQPGQEGGGWDQPESTESGEGEETA